MTGTHIPQSEMDDYHAVLRQCRLVPDDFELLSAAADGPPGSRTYTRGSVSVRRLGTGPFRPYPFSTWVTDFERDPAAGVLR